MRSRLIPLLWLALAAASCPAATVFVDRQSPGPAHDGTTWATAFITIQSAVDAAHPGDEVWVAKGAYTENLLVQKALALYGGFAGTEAARDQRDWKRNATVLDGGGKYRVLLLIAGKDHFTAVDGFSVVNGATTGGGGGIYVRGTATIANTIVYGNIATHASGTALGGGIEVAAQGPVTIKNCLIAGNYSDVGGGLSLGDVGPVTIANCTIVENRSEHGAVEIGYTSSVTIINSLISHNDSGIDNDGGSVILRHCDVYGNGAYDFQGLPDPTGTDGIISQDPKLSSFRSGLYLQPGSPCIDAGDDSLVSPGELDLYGKPRLRGAHVDIGADESDGTLYPPPSPRVWHISQNGDDANDGASWARARKTLRLALLMAEAGDDVWVAAGTYTGVAKLRSGVGLYGGFAGSETDRSQRDPAANVTVLDGTVQTRYGTSAGTVLTLATDASSDTVVDGFTIQNGDGIYGAGLSIPDGSPTISHNIIRSNGLAVTEPEYDTSTQGGGLYIGGGSPTIAHNTFTGNAATRGGGIFVAGGTPIITDNTITSNAYALYGGGIYVYDGMPLIASNTIQGNGSLYGGGVYAFSGLIRDNLIASNHAGPDRYMNGGAAGLFMGPSAVAVHNRILNNVCGGLYPGGGGAYLDGGVLLNNLLQDNRAGEGSALICYGNNTVSRNTITHSIALSTSVQVAFYGGSFTDNLLVSRSGDGLVLTSSLPPDVDSVISNNTIINTGPRVRDWTTPPWVVPGVRNGFTRGERVTFANNILAGWGRATYTYGGGTNPTEFSMSHNDTFDNTDNTLVFPGTLTGNISQDPHFVNAAGGDYRLLAGSPCIDAGDDSVLEMDARDAEGRPRIAGAHVDIGAYEHGSPLYTVLDASKVLRIAAGLSMGTPEEIARLDVVPDTPGAARLTILDAIQIAQWLLN